MVGYNMDGPARDAVLKLMDEKDKIETELREQNAILHANNVGMDDPLVDAEGYPRNDIDVYKVRHARHRIICLKNDLKAIMMRIEQGLWQVYDPNSSQGQSSRSQAPGYTNGDGNHMNGESGVQNGTNNNSTECFAAVGFVQVGSPADLAGLLENDKIIQFGSINHGNFYDVRQFQEVVAHSVGQPIQVRLKRGHQVMNVTVVPRPWAQPGLFGCHIMRL
ncbi:probable 26S proteasome non-ATPase regulatory subunit 9 [Epargyreus clarus]|uniref:probable 26S proteasome non-ATPase regulatory subunit 9 n=1 Tax=Epargyreus clarus TaxID=520877 RepID=UPI003C303214